MRSQLSEKILNHSAAMRNESLEAKIPVKTYDDMCSKLGRLDDAQLLALMRWYLEIRTTEFSEIEKIRKYVPAYVWENYRINPPPRLLTEQKLLKEAQKKLRERWLTRPLFKRKRVRKNVEQESSKRSLTNGS